MKAAIYLRVSTDEQQHANQRPDCERLCAARGWEPLLVVETESGAKERPGWAHVLELARRGEVGAVVFWAIDRIGRTRLQVVHDLEELARWKVALVSHQESFLDLPAVGPMRETLIRWWAWMAEDERDKLIARTKAGLARARAQGKVLGRPRTVTTAQLERAAGEVGAGRPVATAARLAGIGRRTLREYLQKRVAENAKVLSGGNPAEGQR